MGAKTQRAIAYNQQTSGQAAISGATADRAFNERVLGQAQQMLGTDEQVAGYGEDSRLSGYGQRYSLDQDALRGYYSSSSKVARRRGKLQAEYEGVATSANQLLDQAEQAARAGNFEEADRLKAEAQSSLGDRFQAAFRLGGGDAQAQARSLLTGPQAQIVGQQVKTAREFQNWDSQGSVDFRRRLTESSERSIAAEAQSALRQARDFGLQRGAGRMAGAASAIQSETLRKASTQRAQVHSDVNQFFEQYRQQFAQSAVGFAQSWLSGQAGVRDDFQNAMTNLAGMTSEMYGRGSALASGFADQARQASEARQAKRGALYGAGIQGAFGLLGIATGKPSGTAAGQ